MLKIIIGIIMLVTPIQSEAFYTNVSTADEVISYTMTLDGEKEHMPYGASSRVYLDEGVQIVEGSAIVEADGVKMSATEFEQEFVGSTLEVTDRSVKFYLGMNVQSKFTVTFDIHIDEEIETYNISTRALYQKEDFTGEFGQTEFGTVFQLEYKELEEPIVDEPIIEEPVIDIPSVDLPSVEEPIIDVPTIEEPIVSIPDVEEQIELPTVDTPQEEVKEDVMEFNENIAEVKSEVKSEVKHIASEKVVDVLPATGQGSIALLIGASLLIIGIVVVYIKEN